MQNQNTSGKDSPPNMFTERKFVPAARVPDTQRFPLHNPNKSPVQFRENSSIQTSADMFLNTAGVVNSVPVAQNSAVPQWPRDRSQETITSQLDLNTSIDKKPLPAAKHRNHSESPDALDSFLQMPAQQAQQFLLQATQDKSSITRQESNKISANQFVHRFVPTSSRGPVQHTNDLARDG